MLSIGIWKLMIFFFLLFFFLGGRLFDWIYLIERKRYHAHSRCEKCWITNDGTMLTTTAHNTRILDGEKMASRAIEPPN